MASDYLDSFDMFDRLSAKERRVLEQVMTTRTFPAGHVFLRQGDRAGGPRSAMYLILEGQVRVTRHPSGRPGHLTLDRLLSPGATFGLVALVTDHARTATCTAQSNVVVATLERAAVDMLYTSHTHLAATFGLVLARQLARDLRALTTEVAGAPGVPPSA